MTKVCDDALIMIGQYCDDLTLRALLQAAQHLMNEFLLELCKRRDLVTLIDWYPEEYITDFFLENEEYTMKLIKTYMIKGIAPYFPNKINYLIIKLHNKGYSTMLKMLSDPRYGIKDDDLFYCTTFAYRSEYTDLSHVKKILMLPPYHLSDYETTTDMIVSTLPDTHDFPSYRSEVICPYTFEEDYDYLK